MNKLVSRRGFIKQSISTASLIAAAPGLSLGKSIEKPDFPIIDYHVHQARNFTVEQAVALAESRNMKFGIVEHPAPGYAIENDEHLQKYITNLEKYPVYKGLQPVHLNWRKNFSKNLIDQMDYILMDADTIPQDDGGYMYIYLNNLFIDNMDEFMQQYMEHIINILSTEKIDIFARPTYLPINFARYYNEIWTKKRMMTIINLAKENNIALEIQENTRIPSLEFIKLAKKAGVKFTFGTNARNNNAGNFNYCIEMAKQCGLKPNDMLILS